MSLSSIRKNIDSISKEQRVELMRWLRRRVVAEQGWDEIEIRHELIKSGLASTIQRGGLDEVEAAFYISQYEDHTEQGRHLETERSTVTNIVGAVTAAILVFMGTKEFSQEHFPWLMLLSPITLFALGLYGWRVTKTQYDRFLKHMDFAYGFRYLLEEGTPAQGATKLHEIINDFPIHQKKTRLHSLWPAFNLAIAILGGVLFFLIAGWLIWKHFFPV